MGRDKQMPGGNVPKDASRRIGSSQSSPSWGWGQQEGRGSRQEAFRVLYGPVILAPLPGTCKGE